MWDIIKTLLKEEAQRLMRRLLRRPDPPHPYTQSNPPADPDSESTDKSDPLTS